MCKMILTKVYPREYLLEFLDLNVQNYDEGDYPDSAIHPIYRRITRSVIQTKLNQGFKQVLARMHIT